MWTMLTGFLRKGHLMADPAIAPRPSRLWRIILAVSLAINLAIAGLVIGFVLRDERAGPPRGFDATLGPIGSALSREDRRSVLRDIRQSAGSQRRGFDQDLDAIVAAVTARPFDPDALNAALAQGNARRDALLDAARTALVSRVSEMSEEDRAAFAERIVENRKIRKKPN